MKKEKKLYRKYDKHLAILSVCPIRIKIIIESSCNVGNEYKQIEMRHRKFEENLLNFPDHNI